jgi:hypothetical protein
MGFRVVSPPEFTWLTRPHAPEEAPRHVAELSELAGFTNTRANVWRYEPGAKGRRHRHVLHLYEYYFFGDPVRMAGALLKATDPDPYKERVRRFLERVTPVDAITA